MLQKIVIGIVFSVLIIIIARLELLRRIEKEKTEIMSQLLIVTPYDKIVRELEKIGRKWSADEAKDLKLGTDDPTATVFTVGIMSVVVVPEGNRIRDIHITPAEYK